MNANQSNAAGQGGVKMSAILEMPDMVDSLLAYEQGELDSKAMLELFSKLIENGQAWSLQGHYGRTAASLIQNGYIDQTGKILKWQ